METSLEVNDNRPEVEFIRVFWNYNSDLLDSSIMTGI